METKLTKEDLSAALDNTKDNKVREQAWRFAVRQLIIKDQPLIGIEELLLHIKDRKTSELFCKALEQEAVKISFADCPRFYRIVDRLEEKDRTGFYAVAFIYAKDPTLIKEFWDKIIQQKIYPHHESDLVWSLLFHSFEDSEFLKLAEERVALPENKQTNYDHLIKYLLNFEINRAPEMQKAVRKNCLAILRAILKNGNQKNFLETLRYINCCFSADFDLHQECRDCMTEAVSLHPWKAYWQQEELEEVITFLKQQENEDNYCFQIIEQLLQCYNAPGQIASYMWCAQDFFIRLFEKENHVEKAIGIMERQKVREENAYDVIYIFVKLLEIALQKSTPQTIQKCLSLIQKMFVSQDVSLWNSYALSIALDLIELIKNSEYREEWMKLLLKPLCANPKIYTMRQKHSDLIELILAITPWNEVTLHSEILYGIRSAAIENKEKKIYLDMLEKILLRNDLSLELREQAENIVAEIIPEGYNPYPAFVSIIEKIKKSNDLLSMLQ